jgi:hypothetical protein
MTKTLDMSRYDPSSFNSRAITTGQLRRTDSWDAKVYRAMSVSGSDNALSIFRPPMTDHESDYVYPS